MDTTSDERVPASPPTSGRRSFVAAAWIRSIFVLSVIPGLSVSCTTEEEPSIIEDAVNSEVDTAAVDSDSNPADTSRDTETPRDSGTADQPGDCFEVQGPFPHRPPRVHDAGWIKLGSSHESWVGFYTFCSQAKVQGVTVLDTTPGLDVSTSGPEAGTFYSGSTIGVSTVLTARVEGTHRATIRLATSTGYYDFTYELEAGALVSDVGGSCGDDVPCTAGTRCVPAIAEGTCDPMWWGTCQPNPGPDACDVAQPLCDCEGNPWTCVTRERSYGGTWLEPCDS